LKQASIVFQFSITANEKKKLQEHLSADKLTGATEMPALMNFPDNTSYFIEEIFYVLFFFFLLFSILSF